METLGLSSERQKEDSLAQRIFWPTIHNQYDVDLLGQQGFWIAASIGVVNGLLLTLSGQYLLAAIVTFVFLSGACGVRQRSIPASILIFVIYLLSTVAAFVITPGKTRNPLLVLVALTLLLANVRATVMSDTWLSKAADQGDHDLPERSAVTIGDKIANRWPVTVWPKAKWVFLTLATGIVLVSAFNIAFALLHPPVHPSALQPDPSIKLQVTPQR